MTTSNKSTFVTVLAWIFIIFSGFGLLINIGQNFLVHFAFNPVDSMPMSTQKTDFNIMDFFMNNLRIVVAVLGIMILLFLISAIGLLKRKNWARIAIITFLMIAIIYIIMSSLFNWYFFFDLSSGTTQSLDSFEIIFSIMVLVFVLAFVTLLGWLIRKLISKKIVSEFKPPLS